MPYDKDLRDLLKATKKVSRSLSDTVDERAQKLHQSHLTTGETAADEEREKDPED
jgi:hypothetical protein